MYSLIESNKFNQLNKILIIYYIESLKTFKVWSRLIGYFR